MAGIGFQLEKLFYKDKTILGKLRGVLYSIAISSGPWLTTIIAIASIMLIAERRIKGSDLLLFKCIISYTYALSLICFGIIEMPITRYLADKIYINDLSSFRSVYMRILIFILILSNIIGHFIYYFIDEPIFLKIVSVLLFASVMITWTSMIFLSSAKDYQRITGSFFLGTIMTVLITYFFSDKLSLIGFITSFTIGQSITATFLTICVFLESDKKEYESFEFIDYFKRMPILSLIGFSYYLGIWIDKFVFWTASPPNGIHVKGLFYTNLFYDTSMFLAYLTVIPSFAIFLVKIETSFFVYYSYFFKSIERKKGLTFLNRSIDDIKSSFKRTITNMLEIQGLITFLFWYFSEEFINFLKLPPIMSTSFRFGVIGALLQVLFLMGNIILLYFEERKLVLLNYIIFLVTNFLFALITVSMEERMHGIGYLFSTFLTTISTILALNKCFSRINFKTFMTQPFSQSSFTGEL